VIFGQEATAAKSTAPDGGGVNDYNYPSFQPSNFILLTRTARSDHLFREAASLNILFGITEAIRLLAGRLLSTPG